MAFDYSKLSGKIKEKFDTQGNFSAAMLMSERTLSLKLNNKMPWRQHEILKACELLDISVDEVPLYFFTMLVQ